MRKLWKRKKITGRLKKILSFYSIHTIPKQENLLIIIGAIALFPKNEQILPSNSILFSQVMYKLPSKRFEIVPHHLLKSFFSLISFLLIMYMDIATYLFPSLQTREILQISNKNITLNYILI